MAYARSCFWAFAAVFWFGKASFQGLHQKVCCVCVCAQAASVHVRACVRICVSMWCKYVYMHVCMCICMRVCMHLHMVQKCATVISLTPRCGGTLSEPKTWSRHGLLCIRFWFVPEQEANRGKLLRCGNHQSGNQKWQEHLRVRASSLCARVSVRASLRACMVALSAVSHCCQT